MSESIDPRLDFFKPEQVPSIVEGLSKVEWLDISKYRPEWHTQTLAKLVDPADKTAYHLYSDYRFINWRPEQTRGALPAFRHFPGRGEKARYTPLVIIQRYQDGTGQPYPRWALYTRLDPAESYIFDCDVELLMFKPQKVREGYVFRAGESTGPDTCLQFKELLGRLLELPEQA